MSPPLATLDIKTGTEHTLAETGGGRLLLSKHCIWEGGVEESFDKENLSQRRTGRSSCLSSL